MEPLALDNTPLSIDALAPRGPRTPWSPVRTPVRPPGRNPEEEPMLAGATGRRGVTSGGPAWGSSRSTTDDAHPDRFVDDDGACVVTSTTTDGANQSTPVGAHHSRNRERRRTTLVDTHPDGAHTGVHHDADVSESTARHCESEYGAGARSSAPLGEPSVMDAGSGHTRRHHRRRSYSSTEDSSPEVRRRHRI